MIDLLIWLRLCREPLRGWLTTIYSDNPEFIGHGTVPMIFWGLQKANQGHAAHVTNHELKCLDPDG
jgi:hypothetical protein